MFAHLPEAVTAGGSASLRGPLFIAPQNADIVPRFTSSRTTLGAALAGRNLERRGLT